MLGTSNITTTLVGNEIGITSHNIRELCTSSNINKWSKKKPVILDEPAPNRQAAWWKDKFGLCGFTIPSSGNINNIVGKDWTYNQPIGPNTPKRIADFGGYYHQAGPCLTHNHKNGITFNKTTQTSVVFKFETNDPSSTTELAINDFDSGALGDCYLTIKVSGQNTLFMLSAPAKLKEYWQGGVERDALSIEIPASSITSAGQYNIFCFLSTYKYVAGDDEHVATYYAFPTSSVSSPNVILTVTQESPVTISMQSISYSLTGQYKTLAEIEPPFGSPEGSNTWVLNSRGDLYIRMKIVAGSSITLSANQLRVVTNTYWDNGEYTIVGSMYDDSYKEITSPLLLYPGDTKYVYMGYNSALLYKNASGPAIPNEMAPGYNDPIYIQQSVRYYNQGTSAPTNGMGAFYSQYTNGSSNWQFKNVPM